MNCYVPPKFGGTSAPSSLTSIGSLEPMKYGPEISVELSIQYTRNSATHCSILLKFSMLAALGVRVACLVISAEND